MANPWIVLISALDQDQAHADEWWRSASIEEKILVWLVMQRDC